MVAPVRIKPELSGQIVEGPAAIGLVASGVYTAGDSFEFGVGPDIGAVEAVYIQTAGTAGQSITIAIDGYDPASNTWETLITSAAVTSATTSTTIVKVSPTTPSVNNVSAQRIVRRRMRVTLTPADAKNITYSVSVFGADT